MLILVYSLDPAERRQEQCLLSVFHFHARPLTTSEKRDIPTVLRLIWLEPLVMIRMPETPSNNKISESPPDFCHTQRRNGSPKKPSLWERDFGCVQIFLRLRAFILIIILHTFYFIIFLQYIHSKQHIKKQRKAYYPKTEVPPF